MHYKSFSFTADTVAEDGTFTGYASVFNEKDLGGDIVVPTAFDQWLAIYSQGKTSLPILFNHNSDLVLGAFTELKPDGVGLWVKGQLNLETVEGREKRALLKQGALSGMSIGYSFYPGGIKYDAVQEAWMLTNLELWEISLATFPMNTSARVGDVKNLIVRGETPTVRDIERALKDMGIPARWAKIAAKKTSETLGESTDDPVDYPWTEKRRDGGASAELAEAMKGLAAILEADA